MPTTFIEETLDAQAFGYAVCAVQSNALAIDDSIYGECGCEHDCRAMYYQWGVELMNRTQATDCDCAGRCVDPEFACKVIKLLNPGCVECGCGSPDDVPFDCTITQDRTVYQALDADQQLLVPNVAGRTTLVISDLTNAGNNWAAHVGEIGTDDGTGVFSWFVPPTSTIVFSSDNSTYYVTYPGGAGPLYPPIDGDQVGAVVTLVSRVPYVTLLYTRAVVVEISEDQITWTPVYSGPESPLAYGVDVTTTLLNPDFTRTTYYYGEENQCLFQYAEGVIPPYIGPPCGILEYTITPEALCDTNFWEINMEFTQIDGWGTGTITPTVNGVVGSPTPITLGSIAFGQYAIGTLVSFEISGEPVLGPGCTINTQVYADPRVGVQDYTVREAVDADEYAALSGDGNDYYIVSDVSGNPPTPWAAEVGNIWLGGSSTYQVVNNLEVVFAQFPAGPLGFWQNDGGTPRQIFPRPTYTYNTVTGIAAVTLPTLPPFSLAWTSLTMTAFWSGGASQFYNGAPGNFVQGSFTPNPPWSSVTGGTQYGLDGCRISVVPLLDTFTPTGEPDPDFVGLGVNSIVRAGADAGLGDGSFYIGGSFWMYDPATTAIPAGGFTRLDTNGLLDTAFNSNVTDTSFMRVTGATVLGAGANGRYTQVANVNGRVSYELTFSGTDYAISWSGARWEILNVTLGTILYFGATNTTFPSSVLAWTPDTGTSNPTVTTGGFLNVTSRSRINAVEVDSQGRVVVAGDFDTLNDVPCGKIVRFLSTGVRDTTFTGVGFNAFRVEDVTILPDDTIIATTGGAPPTYNGVAVRWVCHIAVNGSLITDITNPGNEWSPTLSGFDASAYRHALAPDGTIVFNGGNYSLYNNTYVLFPPPPLGPPPPEQRSMIRVAQDGTFIETIAQGSQFFEPSAPTSREFAIQPDGKIISVGNFDDYAGTPTGNIIRTDAFGTPDATFVANAGTGFDDQTLGVDVLPNGWIMVGSNAGASYDGTLTGGLTRLDENGALEPTWNLGTGFNGAVYFVVVDSFGDLIVGGNFTQLDGTPYNYVVKL